MKYRKHTKEAKLTILSELKTGKTIAQISSEKNITPSLISKWRRQYEQNPKRAFADHGKISSLESELNECKKVIGELYLEVAFLKVVRTSLQKSLTEQRIKKQEDSTK